MFNNRTGCRHTDVEQPARRRDICQVVIQPPSATKNLGLPVHEVVLLTFPELTSHQ